MNDGSGKYHRSRPAFGRWLLAQRTRADAVGQIALAAADDRRFPKDGDYDAVAKRLSEVGADRDAHHALEEAEIDYLCL